MKILKHFLKVGKSYLSRIGCRHQESHSASCPFTGYTYVTCNKCMKYLSIKETINDKK
jgi:hypothetical protein